MNHSWKYVYYMWYEGLPLTQIPIDKVAAPDLHRKATAGSPADQDASISAIYSAKELVEIPPVGEEGSVSPVRVDPRAPSGSGAVSPRSSSNPPPVPPRPSMALGSNWEKIYDEATKLFYYHNKVTGVTQWEVPSGI